MSATDEPRQDTIGMKCISGNPDGRRGKLPDGNVEEVMEQKEMEELVLRARKKDAEAFSRLYELIYKDLYRYAYYTLKNTHDAEDAVSEAVTDAFFGIEKLREAAAFKGWMFQILSAKCKRKLKGYVDKTLPLDMDIPVQNEDIEENQDLKTALLKLSDKERTILNLSIVAGFKSAEIGEKLHMNHNTVRSIQSRALLKMKEMLMG